MPHLAHISLLVHNYDEAIAWYSRLGFELVEDIYIPEQQKRWVVIRPPASLPPTPSPTTLPSPSTTPSSISPNQPPTQQTISQTQITRSSTTTILLAQPSTPAQAQFIGDQSGGRVFLFLATDDFDRDFQHFTACGVEWVREPKVEGYGTVAVWKDLYGNLWDLVQYS